MLRSYLDFSSIDFDKRIDLNLKLFFSEFNQEEKRINNLKKREIVNNIQTRNNLAIAKMQAGY